MINLGKHGRSAAGVAAGALLIVATAACQPALSQAELQREISTRCTPVKDLISKNLSISGTLRVAGIAGAGGTYEASGAILEPTEAAQIARLDMYCRNWVSGLYNDRQYTDLIATELAGAISLTVPVADQAARIETALAELRRLGEGLPSSLPSASAIALEVQRLNALRPDEVADDLEGDGTSTDADAVTADSLAVIVARLDFLEQVLTADGDPPGRTPPRDNPEVVGRSDGFDVYFSTGSSELTHSGKLAIGQAAQRLARREVIVTGFADARGSADLNRRLSKERADAVATELRAAGVVVRQSVGVGEEMTSSDAYSGARRVQVLLAPPS